MTESTPSDRPSKPKSISKSSGVGNRYTIPEPVRRVFNQFPLLSYSENLIPQRARRTSNKHALYIFRNVFDSTAKDLSCNPTCLKWQAYLTYNDVEFFVVPSNNHASPSGSLPFLLPSATTNEPCPSPITTSKMPRWVSQQVMQEEDVLNMEQEAYITLIEQNIRNAWLYHLYLQDSNFETVARPLYVSTASSNRLVQIMISHELREAAKAELLRSRHIIDAEEVYSAAARAFGALSIFLGDRTFFSKSERPELFDASIFAYTQLLLDDSFPWSDTTLSDILRDYPSLVQHRDRALRAYTTH